MVNEDIILIKSILLSNDKDNIELGVKMYNSLNDKNQQIIGESIYWASQWRVMYTRSYKRLTLVFEGLRIKYPNLPYRHFTNPQYD